MARWQQAVELAMTDEDIEKLTAIARKRNGASGGASADTACVP
jgi:hypothetical protein